MSIQVDLNEIRALEAAGFQRQDTAAAPYWALRVDNVEVCFEPRVYGGWDLGVYEYGVQATNPDGTPELAQPKKLNVHGFGV